MRRTTSQMGTRGETRHAIIQLLTTDRHDNDSNWLQNIVRQVLDSRHGSLYEYMWLGKSMWKAITHLEVQAPWKSPPTHLVSMQHLYVHAAENCTTRDACAPGGSAESSFFEATKLGYTFWRSEMSHTQLRNCKRSTGGCQNEGALGMRQWVPIISYPEN